MTGRNSTHLSVKADVEAAWVFVLPVKADTCSEATHEIKSICSDIFQLFNGFIVPKEINLTFVEFEGDPTLSEVDENWDPIDTFTRTITNGSGVTPDEFVEASQTSGSATPLLRNVTFSHNGVWAVLEDGEQLVDRSTGTRFYSGNRELDVDPYFDPIEVVVRQASNFDETDVSTDFVFYLNVNIYTDVIYSDSDIGRANRQRLVAFLSRITDELPVETIHRDPNKPAVRDIY